MENTPNLRRTRTNYALCYVGTNAIFYVLTAALQNAGGVLAILLLVNIGLVMYFAAGRLKDMNANPWWALATLIPFVGFILMFPKGTDGTNQYGENPRAKKDSSLQIKQRNGE